MIDVDRVQYWQDIVSAPLCFGTLCVVLLGYVFTQPVGLEIGIYGVAALLCVVATAASLLLARQRVTDWELSPTYSAAIRTWVSMGWLLPLVLLLAPQISSPEWQLLIAVPATILAMGITAVLLVICYNSLSAPLGESVSNVA